MRTSYFKSIDKVEKLTIPSKISNQLRQAILAGEFAGGTQLKQEELAMQFNVSMSALREALKTLEAEGLVKFYPNRGAEVTALSVEEAQEIFEIRLLLELGALEFALPLLTSKDLAAAEVILAALEKEENCDQWSELNYSFHEQLYKSAGKMKLLAMIRILHNNVQRYMRLYLAEMHYQNKSQQEHKELLEACKQKNKSKAKKILKIHLESASKMLRKYLLACEKEKSGGVR